MLALVAVTMGQTTTVPAEDPASSDLPDEIVVYGKKSLVHLRSELYRAQEDFFALFNSLNSNDDFNVKCGYVTYLGDRRRHHVCTPQFTRKAESRAAARVLEDMNSPAGQGTEWGTNPYREKTEKTEEIMWSEMASLVLTHPELQKEFTKLANAKRGYDSEIERRRQKR